MLEEIEKEAIKGTPDEKSYDKRNNVFNGVAYDEQEDVFYVTGKKWQHIFKVKLNYGMLIDDKAEVKTDL